jgi:hypothetical protein
VLYLADVAFPALGLPANIPPHPLGDTTDAVLGHLPDVVLLAGSLLFGLQWIIHRRDLLAEERLEAREEVRAEARDGPPESVVGSPDAQRTAHSAQPQPAGGEATRGDEEADR